MRITLINTSDTVGGASIACRRLLHALHHNGVEARMLVKEQNSSDPLVQHTGWQQKHLREVHHGFEKLHFLMHERDKSVRFAFSTAKLGLDIRREPTVEFADILHFHWVNKGFLSLQGMAKLAKLGKPIVWTLHDMWAFTGGCHYSADCTRYTQACGQCRQFLKNPSENDLSHRVWQQKKQVFASLNLRVVACSRWLADTARSSSLLAGVPVTNIPNPIDTDVFSPATKPPRERMTVLFQAMNVNDERKGFAYLLDALSALKTRHPQLRDRIELLVFGKSKPETFANIDIPVRYLGLLSRQEDIIAAYRDCDVFVIPSLEENLPNTIMEAMACGKPVVAFASGGIPEMVQTGENGYLAATKNAADLADGIAYVLAPDRYPTLADGARQKTLRDYSEAAVAARYLDVYRSF